MTPRWARSLTLLLAAATVSACQNTPAERVVDLVVPVTVQPVETGSVEAIIESTGTLRPLREGSLVAEIRGQLFYETLADGRPAEGVRVTEGEPVARLESEEWTVGLRLDSREKAVENAKRNLAEKEALRDEGLTVESDVDTARKQLIDAETDLADGLIQREKMRVLAPITGFLTELSDVTESTRVEQNEVIGKVVDYTRVLVDLNIPNSHIGALRVGQPVRITNFAFPERSFPGRLTVIDPALDPSTRTFEVQASLANPERVLRPGMFVKAEIITELREDVIVIPRELVLTRQNRDVVFIESEGRAEMRQVELGLENAGMVEVLDGLEAGERLITSNYETLRTRTPVRVTGQAAPGS